MAVNHEEADHVPLTFRDTALPETYGKPVHTQFEAVDIFLRLGIDPMLYLTPDDTWELDPDVKVKTRKEILPGEKFPCLIKEYITPNGTLSQVVRQTPDWPHGDKVPLWSDFMVPRSRSKKYLVENMEDVEIFSSLFSEPTARELKAFHQKAERFDRFAKDRGIIINAAGMNLGDITAWSCGIENEILWSLRNTEVFHKLLDVVLEWNMKHLEQVLEPGVVDVVTCRGYYETIDIWSPKLHRIFFAPRLKKLAETVHKAGAKFCYHMTTGIMPALDIIKDIGVDILYGPDPVEGTIVANLQQVKDRAGDDICLWGGMNAPVTLGLGTPKQIEEAVKESVGTLAPGGGFILAAMESIILGPDPKVCGSIPWESIEHMINVWRTTSDYPVR